MSDNNETWIPVGPSPEALGAFDSLTRELRTPRERLATVIIQWPEDLMWPDRTTIPEEIRAKLGRNFLVGADTTRSDLRGPAPRIDEADPRPKEHPCSSISTTPPAKP